MSLLERIQMSCTKENLNDSYKRELNVFDK